ncbi:hypothetical protein UlMin_041707 [Ulmus minor]
MDNASVDFRNHCKVVDSKKNRVECLYCAKVVSGFPRFKCHLGGIRGNVTPCENVPAVVKNVFRDIMNQSKKEYLAKESGEIQLPQKRNRSACSTSQTDVTEPCGSLSSQNGSIDEIITDLESTKIERCIGRFFYETGIDFSVASSPGFKKLMSSIIGLAGHVEYKIPKYQELKGPMLHDEVKEMEEYLKKIRNSWAITGCSILLDGWTDQMGRNLINILVDCPEGPIYLFSYDISSSVGDTETLQLFLETIIEDVGVNNVVQIVAHSTTGWVEVVGKKFMDRCKKVFWTVSASHCIDLMLEKIGTMASIRKVLDKAKTITKLIHSRAEVLELLKKHTGGHDIIKPSKIKSATPFLILENIMQEKQKLKNMVDSSEWKTSIWACREEGKRVAELVLDHSFWTEAEMALKAAIPLVRVLNLIFETDKPLVGFIYEVMDQAKETIRDEFQNKRAQYMPFWKVIDEIWNDKLHSPLHSAGYYLNPSLFYSTDFYGDAEVAFGLLCCVVRMVRDQESQYLITRQLEEYRHSKGGFEDGIALDQGTTIPPTMWWSSYRKKYPELQKFAIRILSQNCDGASRYGLKRSLAEKLLVKGRNPIEQRRLSDLAFVHYNLHLKQFHSGKKSDIVAEDIDSMYEWIVNETTEAGSGNGEPSRMNLHSAEGAVDEEMQRKIPSNLEEHIER